MVISFQKEDAGFRRHDGGGEWGGRLETFALDAFTLHFAGAADGFGGFAGAALGGFFVVAAEFHLAEHAFALKFLFERLQRLVDVIVANENLHLADYSWVGLKNDKAARPGSRARISVL
jgi:hypothetical protein